MATLVLTTLGTALGGPVGGALGSIIGQSIDQNLFGPAARRGPRLGDLRVQTSSYGSAIARIYGRMRVAGTVVWATDLREEEVASGGGKGAPGAIQFAYSASFAVALSSRIVKDVGRIWADGKLLRGSDGMFKSKVRYRFYPGSEEQPVDPLIASIEGAAGSPAFRGVAVAVFEDLALADYGNRIPSLTFELIADEEPPRVAEVIADVSAGAIEVGSDEARLLGFAALGSDRRAAVAPLVDLWGGTYHDDGVQLRVNDGGVAPVAIGDAVGAGCFVEGDRAVLRAEREQDAADSLPASLTIEYYDPDRDYQAGQMRATSSTGGRSVRRMDSACAMLATTAKSLASDALARRWAGRDRVTLRLAPSFLDMKPGAVVSIDALPGRYRVENVTVNGLVVVIEARRIAAAGRSLGADAGRATTDPDVVPGRSIPILLDLPATGVAQSDSFGVTLAVGSDGRLKPTPVAIEINGQLSASLRVDRAAITGMSVSILESGPTCAIDANNSVDVRLSDAGATLYHADDAALAMGANAMMVGRELLQFGRATKLPNGDYRLARLVRGCRATDWAVSDHGVGERVVLIDPDRLLPIPMDPAMIGAQVEARAYGIADDEADPPTATIIAGGESLRSLSPCHLSAAVDADGLRVQWVARRKSAIPWSASADEVGPVTYQLSIRRGGQAILRETGATALTVALAELPPASGGPIEIEVVELGTLTSRPASLTLVT